MKRLAFLFLFLGTFYFLKAQVKVGADKSFSANISDYKTYAWATNIDEIPSDQVFVGDSGILLFNNESTRKKIKDAIQYQLDAKGYKMQPTDADMVVTFEVSEKPAQLRTYNGYEMINSGFDSVRTQENVEMTDVNAGTLIIDILDRRSGKVAWQGYASGILKRDMMNDESKIRQAVESIFDKFNYRAKA